MPDNRTMKRIVFLLILTAFLSGCAASRQSQYVVPKDIDQRLTMISSSVHACIIPTVHQYYVYESADPNGAAFEDRIMFSSGLFDLDDNTIKFTIAHEIAHQRLGHVRGLQTTKAVTTGILAVLNIIIPGAGALGLIAHPVGQATYSKPAELEADAEAYKACLCMGMTKEDVIRAMESLLHGEGGGGILDRHPAAAERIEAIRSAH